MEVLFFFFFFFFFFFVKKLANKPHSMIYNKKTRIEMNKNVYLENFFLFVFGFKCLTRSSVLRKIFEFVQLWISMNKKQSGLFGSMSGLPTDHLNLIRSLSGVKRRLFPTVLDSFLFLLFGLNWSMMKYRIFFSSWNHYRTNTNNFLYFSGGFLRQ